MRPGQFPPRWSRRCDVAQRPWPSRIEPETLSETWPSTILRACGWTYEYGLSLIPHRSARIRKNSSDLLEDCEHCRQAHQESTTRAPRYRAPSQQFKHAVAVRRESILNARARIDPDPRRSIREPPRVELQLFEIDAQPHSPRLARAPRDARFRRRSLAGDQVIEVLVNHSEAPARSGVVRRLYLALGPQSLRIVAPFIRASCRSRRGSSLMRRLARPRSPPTIRH
jgi:hypothetical protein